MKIIILIRVGNLFPLVPFPPLFDAFYTKFTNYINFLGLTTCVFCDILLATVRSHMKKTIIITLEAHTKLKLIAAQRVTTMQKVIEDLVEREVNNAN